MFPEIEYSRAEQELKGERACHDNICRKNQRNRDHTGDNQQNRERLLCKIHLC